jgi:hypothetical protein
MQKLTMRSVGPTMLIAVLALCIGRPAASRPLVSAEDWAGRWRGTYVCPQGLTGVLLNIERSEAGDVSAVFSFFAVPQNARVPSGEWDMAGRAGPQTNHLRLSPTMWIRRPPGWVMVGFDGDYDENSDTYSGSVFGLRGCTRFVLRREQSEARDSVPAVAKPQPAPAVAVAAPPSAPAAPATSAAPERRIALVIGNSRYAAQAPLRNPANDATAIAGALRAAGFQEVDTANDLSRDALVKALHDFQDKADGSDWALIYFSGHGVEVGGTTYVVPTDARLRNDRDIQDEAITVNRLMEDVSGARKLKIVIVDACRDNPFTATMRRTASSRAITKGLGPVEPLPATLVVYAAKNGQLAQDGDGANSPFAAALARRLAETHLEVSKLFRLVTDDVLDATAQKQQPFVYGSLPGREDFFFRP